eukprot:9493150-Pyramimonas_sp.AAC.1
MAAPKLPHALGCGRFDAVEYEVHICSRSRVAEISAKTLSFLVHQQAIHVPCANSAAHAFARTCQVGFPSYPGQSGDPEPSGATPAITQSCSAQGVVVVVVVVVVFVVVVVLVLVVVAAIDVIGPRHWC